MHAEAVLDRSILSPRDQWSMKNMEFCNSAAVTSASNGSHVTLSQHLSVS